MEKCSFLRELSAHSLDIERWLWTAATIFPHVHKLEDVTGCQGSGPVLLDSPALFTGDFYKANRSAELLIGEPVLDSENQVRQNALQRAAGVFSTVTRFDLYLALTNYVAAQLLGTSDFFQSDEELIELLQYYVGDVRQLAGELVAVFEAHAPTNGFPYVRKRFKLSNSAALYQALIADRYRCADEISMRLSLTALQLRGLAKEQQIGSLAALLKELNLVYFEHKNALFDCLYGQTANCSVSNSQQRDEQPAQAQAPAAAKPKSKKLKDEASQGENQDLSALYKLLLGERPFHASAVRSLVEKLYATFGIAFDVKNRFQRQSALIDEVSSGIRRMRDDFPEIFAEDSLSQLQSICDCFGLELPGVAAASSLEICSELHGSGLATPIRCSVVSNCQSVILFQDVFSLARFVQEFQELDEVDGQALQSDFLAAFEKLTGIQAESPAHALDRMRLAVSAYPASYLTAAVLSDVSEMRVEFEKPLYKVNFSACAAVFYRLVRCAKAARVACPHASTFIGALACSAEETRELKLAQFPYQQLTGGKHVLYRLSAKQADALAYQHVFGGLSRLESVKLLGIIGVSCVPPYVALEFLLCASGSEECTISTLFGCFPAKKVVYCVKHLGARRVVPEFEGNCFLCSSHLLCDECDGFDDALERCRQECQSDYVLRQIARLDGRSMRTACLSVLRLFAEMTLASDVVSADLRGYPDVSIAQQAHVYQSGAQWLMI